MSASLPLRLKYVCGRYGRAMIVSLVVLSALLFVGAAVAEPSTQQKTVQTNEQRVSTELTASGEVVSDSSLYEERETVTDSPVYMMGSIPVLTLEAASSVPSEQSVTVTHEITLQLSAERQGEVFWTDQRTVANRTQRVSDGTAQTTATLDVASLAENRLRALEADTNGVGTVRARVVLDTSYETDAYTGSTTISSPLTVSDRYYEFDTPRKAERIHTTPVVQNNTAAPSGVGALATAIGIPGQSVWLLFAGLLGLVGAVAIKTVNVRTGDFEAFERRYESVRYAEWISRGRIPDTGQYARVPVERLVDLVDIAIDSEKRVIYDTEQEYYAVVDGNLIYEFREESDAPGRMHEFGLAPIDGESVTPEQALQEAEAMVTTENGDAGGDGSSTFGSELDSPPERN